MTVRNEAGNEIVKDHFAVLFADFGEKIVEKTVRSPETSLVKFPLCAAT